MPRTIGARSPFATLPRMALAVGACLLLPIVVGAQAGRDASPHASAPAIEGMNVPAARAVGPRAGALQVGVQAGVPAGERLDVRLGDRAEARFTAAAAPTLQPPVTRRRGVPQMIIGGAALVGGAIIGDDAGTLVMLGGLGYGLYGLYLYLQ